jgi:hypothetical protein
MFGLSELGFAGMLQVVLMVFFVAVGLGAVLFQRSLGVWTVQAVLAMLAVVAIVTGYSTHSFVMSTIDAALAMADPAQSDVLYANASKTAMAHWKIAAVNVVLLVGLAFVSAGRAFLKK